MRFLLVCALIVLLYTVSAATKSLTTADKQNLRQTIHTQLNAENLDNKSQTEKLTTIFYGVTSLLKLDKIDLSEEQKQNLCKIIAETDTTKTIKTNYEYVVSSLALKCGANLASLEDVTKQQVEQEKLSYSDLYSLVRIIFLTRKQFSSLPKDKDVLSKLFNRVASKYNEETGAFSSDESIQKLGYAYEILSILQNLMVDADSKASEELLTTLVKIARQADKFVSKTSAASLKDVSVYVRGLNKLATIVPLKKISRENIDQIADDVVSKKPQDKLEDIFDFAEAVAAVAQSSIFVPVVVSQINRKENAVSVTISDILGNKISDKVTILSVSTSQAKVASDVVMKLEDENTYTANIDASKFKGAGVYRFEISIATPKQEIKITRTIVSEAAVELRDITFSVISKETDREIASQQTTYPEKLSTVLVIDNAVSKKLAIFFELFAAPHQVFVKFTNNKQEAILALKKQDDRLYRIDINFEKVVSDLFGYVSGEYEVSVIIGDVTMKTPLQWAVGTVELQFPQGPVDEVAELFALRPEIKHKFAEPAKRAPKDIATMVAAAVVGVPLLFLLIGLAKLQPSLTNCPGGISFLAALLFQLLILSMLATIAYFWIEITIFDTFKCLGILGVAAAIVGTKALRGFVALRTKKD